MLRNKIVELRLFGSRASVFMFHSKSMERDKYF
jgi:hypothetical protein